jgi:glycosyltransferase involved in cell wall biosynthesis
MITIAYCIPYHNLTNFTNELTVGGAQRHLLQVLRKIDLRRFQPILFCVVDGSEKLVYTELKTLGIEIINIDIKKGKLWHWENLRQLFRMVEILRHREVRVVHGYLFEGNFLGMIAGRLAGVPVIITSKRSLDQHSRLKLSADKLSNYLSTRVTANSVAVRDHVHKTEGCSVNKMVVIPNGVDYDISPASEKERFTLRETWGIPLDAFVVGTVARFGWKKGYEYFLQMAASVLEERQNVRFVAIGDGLLRKKMERMAEDVNIAPYVIFTGWQSDAMAKMPIFDLYVCTSIIEGMSNALLEAMAQGLPVVATSVGGNKENIIDGVTGYLTPPKDPQTMVKRVIELIDNPELLGQMGEAGKHRVAIEYTAEQMVQRMEDLYDGLLREKGIIRAGSGYRWPHGLAD